MISSVTVFCGSSNVVDDKYFAAATELGEKLARRRWRLIYGGGRVGLMGALSRAMLKDGGEVTGVIPKALLDLGVGDENVTELIVTDGLRDRKAIMPPYRRAIQDATGLPVFDVTTLVRIVRDAVG